MRLTPKIRELSCDTLFKMLDLENLVTAAGLMTAVNKSIDNNHWLLCLGSIELADAANAKSVTVAATLSMPVIGPASRGPSATADTKLPLYSVCHVSCSYIKSPLTVFRYLYIALLIIQIKMYMC